MQLSGTVSSLSGRCPNISFVVSGMAVLTNSDTVFSGGKCGDVKNGVFVAVTGLEQSTGSVLASAVQISKN